MKNAIKNLFILCMLSAASLTGCSQNRYLTVTFDAGEGVFDNGENILVVKTKKNKTIDYPENPYRKGYECANQWMDGDKRWYSTEPIKENITLTADWTVKKYTIQYNLDGGKFSEYNPSSYTIEDEIYFNQPTKENYSFIGWFFNGNKIDKIEKGTTGDLKLFAFWEKAQSEIIINNHNPSRGNVYGTTHYSFGDSASIVAVPNIGYKFDGWYKDGSLISRIESLEFIVSESLYNLDAYFSPIQFNIEYELDGGTFNGPRTYNIESDDIVLDSPNKRGYKFLNWELNDQIITCIKKGTYGNLKLKAKWDLNTFKVIFDANEDILPFLSGNGEYAFGSTVYINAEKITGYDFKYWLYKGTIISYKNGFSLYIGDEDIVLKPVYNPSKVEITLTDRYGGRGELKGQGRYTVDEMMTITAEPYEGYEFVAWYIDDTIVSYDAIWELIVPNINTTYNARFKMIGRDYFDLTNNQFTYGKFPQELVTDDELIEDLNSRYEPTLKYDNNYYNYRFYYCDVDVDDDGEFDYRAIKFYYLKPKAITDFSNYVDNTTYVTNYGYEIDITYWFKYQPLKWNVFTNIDGELLAYSSCIIDSMQFLSSWSFGYEGKYYYRDSDACKFLNTDFLNWAFNPIEKTRLLKNRSNIKVPTMNQKRIMTKVTPTDYAHAMGYNDISIMALEEGDWYNYIGYASRFGLVPVICVE